MNLKEWREEIFCEHEGHFDASVALEYGASLELSCYEQFIQDAAEYKLESYYKTWIRGKTQRLEVEQRSSQLALIKLDKHERKLVRERVVLTRNGERLEYDTLSLEGETGAWVLRQVAARDEKSALTTLARASLLRRIADAVEAATVKAGRPVAVKEVVRGISDAA